MRYDWTLSEVREIYHRPLLSLIMEAAAVHRQFHKPGQVQTCTLLSIKTGGCPEDCAYCAQSVRYQTGVQVHRLLDVEVVVEAARQAKEAGATRFCMGAAWREVRNNRDFERVLEMVRRVRALGLEVCATLGMLTPEQALALKEAGLTAYNHNLDTSESYYSKVITTRKYEDRLHTLAAARAAGLRLCSGGILGLGESDEDRIALLHTLATMQPHPESVPINALVPIEGTPLADAEPPSVWEIVRAIATARILMPQSMIRLAAGRERLSPAEQALCFVAGANSIFLGEKLLTAPNAAPTEDARLFTLLGIEPLPAFAETLHE
ncbi:MAG: biotin synthase BioB [Bacteroidia bacterium]|nr:biotin synthase BioB [Bacteroidia bacterium]MCX7764816.1 biotin synthase BioB [Bacteroidia bacterium]MDW8057513.1 biotin synthase BioB [Bacteroidia bacterium]